jgi:hypothetical protein
MTKRWLGDPPEKCDACSTPITDKFYDAATLMGPWGHLCPSCHTLGPGLGRLGPGLGQEYTRAADGTWPKTGG